MRRMLKLSLVTLGLALAVVAAGVLWLKLAPRRVPSGQPPLATLEPATLAAFRDTFNGEEDGVRVLVLLSPT